MKARQVGTVSLQDSYHMVGAKANNYHSSLGISVSVHRFLTLIFHLVAKWIVHLYGALKINPNTQ